MKRSLLHSYGLIATLIVVLGPLFANGITTPSSRLANTLSLTCDTQFNYDSSVPISVLVISSGTTGHICVEYSNIFNNSFSVPVYVSIYEYNSSGQYGVCPGCKFNVVTSLFKITTTPDAINLDHGRYTGNQTEKVTVSITVPTDLKSGIFGIFITQFCSLFPMVVIPSDRVHVELTMSDISSWYPHIGSCPAQVLGRSLLGVEGFQIVSLGMIRLPSPGETEETNDHFS